MRKKGRNIQQTFYVSLRVDIDPNVEKELTEAAIKRWLEKQLKGGGEIDATVNITNVVDDTDRRSRVCM